MSVNKKEKKKSNWIPVLVWILDIFCILAAFSYMPSLAAFLFLFLGIAGMPIAPIRNLWKKLPLAKVLKPTILTILFFLTCSVAPVEPTETSMQDTQVAVESATEDIQITENEQIEDVPAKEPETSVVAEDTFDEEPQEEIKEDGTNSTTLTGNEKEKQEENNDQTAQDEINPLGTAPSFSLSDIPTYSDAPYVAVNNNTPFFMDSATLRYPANITVRSIVLADAESAMLL